MRGCEWHGRWCGEDYQKYCMTIEYLLIKLKEKKKKIYNMVLRILFWNLWARELKYWFKKKKIKKIKNHNQSADVAFYGR